MSAAMAMPVAIIAVIENPCSEKPGVRVRRAELPKIVDRLFEEARILKAWHIEQEQEQERWRQEAAQENA